jgi:hypothetical protein
MRKEQGNMNIDDLKNKKMDEIVKMGKKGKSLMMFITVSDNPTRAEAEKLTSFWQNSLFNANYEIQR